jgi:hypothetical protein
METPFAESVDEGEQPATSWRGSDEVGSSRTRTRTSTSRGAAISTACRSAGRATDGNVGVDLVAAENRQRSRTDAVGGVTEEAEPLLQDHEQDVLTNRQVGGDRQFR